MTRLSENKDHRSGRGRSPLAALLAGAVLSAAPLAGQTVQFAGIQSTVDATGLNQPNGVAVDAAGDLFIANTNNHLVLKVAPNGTQTMVAFVGSGLSFPTGVAVDGAGDVFIVDGVKGNNLVLKVAPNGTQTPVGSGFNGPNGVAVDAAGDVFIADEGNNRVVKVAPNGTQTTVGSGLNNPNGVAVDAAGNVFITDTGNNRVLEVQTTAAQFGAVNLCPAGQSGPAPCSQTLTLPYTVTAAGTLGTPQVLTDGVPNRDFTLASGSTCSGFLPSGSSCTVNVTFTPQVAGLRRGAVQIVDTSGNVLATTFLQGLGAGPQIAFGPGAQSAVGSGLYNPYGVAVDTAGDVFIADPDQNRVVKVAPNGTQSTVGSGLYDPTGAAVDGAGNVIIADSANNRVVKVAPNGTQTVVVGSGLSGPTGVAVDAVGNVFVADRDNHRVLKVAPNGTQSTVGSGLQNPYGVTVDAAGNVIIADSMHNRVVKVAPNGTQTTVGNFGFPTGVAVDAAGTVFVAEQSNNLLVAVAPDGTQTTVVGSGLNAVSGVAVDGTGNVFLADRGNNRVLEVARSQVPSLSFAATPVGSLSSPQALTVANIGNAPLAAVAPGLMVGANFAQVSGSGTPADCTAKFALTPGGSCNLSLIFKPTQTGSLATWVVLVDNAGNAAPQAYQIINAQGVGR